MDKLMPDKIAHYAADQESRRIVEEIKSTRREIALLFSKFEEVQTEMKKLWEKADSIPHREDLTTDEKATALEHLKDLRKAQLRALQKLIDVSELDFHGIKQLHAQKEITDKLKSDIEDDLLLGVTPHPAN